MPLLRVRGDATCLPFTVNTTPRAASGAPCAVSRAVTVRSAPAFATDSVSLVGTVKHVLSPTRQASVDAAAFAAALVSAIS